MKELLLSDKEKTLHYSYEIHCNAIVNTDYDYSAHP